MAFARRRRQAWRARRCSSAARRKNSAGPIPLASPPPTRRANTARKESESDQEARFSARRRASRSSAARRWSGRRRRSRHNGPSTRQPWPDRVRAPASAATRRCPGEAQDGWRRESRPPKVENLDPHSGARVAQPAPSSSATRSDLRPLPARAAVGGSSPLRKGVRAPREGPGSREGSINSLLSSQSGMLRPTVTPQPAPSALVGGSRRRAGPRKLSAWGGRLPSCTSTHARRSYSGIPGRRGRAGPGDRRDPVAPRTKTTSLPAGGTCRHSTSAPWRERSRRRASISPESVSSFAASNTRARLAERLPADALAKFSAPMSSFQPG